MTENERRVLLDAIVAGIPGFEDLASADYGELEQGLLYAIALIGGADRSYKAGRSVNIPVGGKDREVDLAALLEVFESVHATMRSFSRSHTPAVKAILATEEMRSYLEETFGSGVDPMIVRGDLLHKDYTMKYGSEKYAKKRRERLGRQQEESEVGETDYE
jgi:hypothetical protein